MFSAEICCRILLFMFVVGNLDILLFSMWDLKIFSKVYLPLLVIHEWQLKLVSFSILNVHVSWLKNLVNLLGRHVPYWAVLLGWTPTFEVFQQLNTFFSLVGFYFKSGF